MIATLWHPETSELETLRGETRQSEFLEVTLCVKVVQTQYPFYLLHKYGDNMSSILILIEVIPGLLSSAGKRN